MAEYHYKFRNGRPVSGGTTEPKTASAGAPKPPGASYRYSAAPKDKKEPEPEAGRTRAASQLIKSRSPGSVSLIGGSILTGGSAAALAICIVTLISGNLSGPWFFIPFGLACVLALALAGSLALLGMGLSKRAKSRRWKKYLALLGQEDEADLSALAKATGHSHRRVRADLQDMLDAGVLPTGYLDLSRDKLILSDKGIFQQPPEDLSPQKAEPQGDEAILAEIRAVNDSIPGEEMSAKIARIEEITGKILEYQRTNPDKAGQLRSFLNYYLPTTLKILRAYAQLDRQGVDGENISATKARIEGMMDKVVEGFEKQLDKLFENTAMDITSDVVVLERMLDKDGLSGGMTIGG